MINVNRKNIQLQKPTQTPINKNKILKNNYSSKVKQNIIFLIKNPIQTKNSSISPNFEYEGGDGFKCVKFNLKPNEAVRADGGTMNYIKNNINIETKTNGILSGIFRKFSGSSFFFNIFRNVGNTLGSVTFSGINPGSIGCFYIPPGKKFNFVSDTYVCSTTNLDIKTNIKFGGILLGYGLTFVQVQSNDGNPGLVWISSFGEVIELILKKNESVKIDNGVLLGFDSDIQIKTESIGGVKSFFFSGEALISKIINENDHDISIYVQGRSKTQYINYIQKVASSDKSFSLSIS